MMETKNWKQIIVLVGGILVGIVTGTIITAHHFGKMGGRAFPEFIFCGTAGILIASILKYLVDKCKGINTTTSKLTLAVGLCVIVGLLIGAGIGYHYFSNFFKPQPAVYEGITQNHTPTNWQSTKIEPTKEVPTMMDVHLTPQPGEYFTYRGNKSKILLNDSRLKYCFLELKDICPPDAANVGDLGIVITGTIKNEYDRDYYICMAAHAFNSEGEQIGGSIDRGPVCGVIAPYVKSGQTRDFELHLKYKEDIERIVLSVGCVSEIPPP